MCQCGEQRRIDAPQAGVEILQIRAADCDGIPVLEHVLLIRVAAHEAVRADEDEVQRVAAELRDELFHIAGGAVDVCFDAEFDRVARGLKRADLRHIGVKIDHPVAAMEVDSHMLGDAEFRDAARLQLIQVGFDRLLAVGREACMYVIIKHGVSPYTSSGTR